MEGSGELKRSFLLLVSVTRARRPESGGTGVNSIFFCSNFFGVSLGLMAAILVYFHLACMLLIQMIMITVKTSMIASIIASIVYNYVNQNSS